MAWIADPEPSLAQWFERDPRRSVPEIDFGATWTTEAAPGVEWRVSWNPGSGELYAARRDGTAVEILARYATEHAATEAVTGWATAAPQPDGLDTLRAHLRDVAVDRVDAAWTRWTREHLARLQVDPDRDVPGRLRDREPPGRPDVGLGL